MTEQDTYPTGEDVPGFPYVEAKLGGQRKLRRWLVQPTDDDRIIVQTDGAIGCFHVSGRDGRLNLRGGYFPHLNPVCGAQPFTFPPGFVRAALSCCRPLDAETDTGRGVIVCSTVRMIGGERS
jgi:hypothetical protein